MRGWSALLLALILVVTAAVGVVGLGMWRATRLGAPATMTPTFAQLALTLALTSTPTLTPTIAQTATPAPTATATLTPMPTPMPTPTPAPLYAPAQPAALLTGIRHEWQTWNNCGPATLAMNLSFFGSSLDQAAIGAVLRPYPDDKNVSPYELVNFAQSQGYRAVELVNGNDDLLRALVSNGIPVLLETWHEPAPDDGLGHYRLLVGYDDGLQQWTLYDSYDAAGLVSTETYAGIRMEYAKLAAWWKLFNRAFVLVYPPAQESLVAALLADFGVTPARMWTDAEVRARAELALDANDAFAWFNLGGSLVAQGRSAEAAAAFDQARALGLPWRMLWYQFGPFAAYLAEGRVQDVLALTDDVIRVTDSIEEIYTWRARALLAAGDVAGAQVAVQRALALAPTFPPALELSSQLANTPSG
jgi:tetratricopeptide (TPR) repeat protein